MSLHIAGIGTSVPEYEIAQEDAAEQAATLCCHNAEQQRILNAVYRRTGVRQRYSVVLESGSNGHSATQSFYMNRRTRDEGPSTAERMLVYESHSAPLAIGAARRALQDACVGADEISHLITVSCSGFSAPGVRPRVDARAAPTSLHDAHQHRLHGLQCCIQRAACCQSLCRVGCSAHILVCAVELCTVHHQYKWRKDQIVANALFGDGSAAIVGKQPTDCATAWQVVDQRSVVLPNSRDYMHWRIRDHGFEMSLSSLLPQLIADELRPFLQGWLSEHHLSVGQIESWAIHPGGPRILQACSTALGIDSRALAVSHEILAEFGNMSSPTILFILERCAHARHPAPASPSPLDPASPSKRHSWCERRSTANQGGMPLNDRLSQCSQEGYSKPLQFDDGVLPALMGSTHSSRSLVGRRIPDRRATSIDRNACARSGNRAWSSRARRRLRHGKFGTLPCQATRLPCHRNYRQLRATSLGSIGGVYQRYLRCSEVLMSPMPNRSIFWSRISTSSGALSAPSICSTNRDSFNAPRPGSVLRGGLPSVHGSLEIEPMQMRVKQMQQVCEGFFCPSLGTQADYRRWIEQAGFELQTFHDWTSAVDRTWEICRNRVRRTGVRWLARS